MLQWGGERAVAGKMKALAKTRRGTGLDLIETDIPVAGPGEVLVKVEATSICGTDLHIYRWDEWSQKRIAVPRVTGHEGAGYVVQVGPDVKGFREGDYVTFESHHTCGLCFQCRTGQAHVCREYRIFGVDVDGCFAEYAKAPAGAVWLNPPDLPVEHACIQDPFGNAVMSALSGEVAAQSVLVIGCGAIGLFSIAIAKSCGASQVIGVDLNEYRLDLARKVGATTVFNPRRDDWVAGVRDITGGSGVDVVLEMSGNAEALKAGLTVVRNAGRVSLLGIPSEPVYIDLARDVIFKGLRLDGITGRRLFDTWYKSSSLLQRVVDVGPILTHRFSLEDYEKGFDLMDRGDCGKIILYPGGIRE